MSPVPTKYLKGNKPVAVPSRGARPPAVHLFDGPTVDAVNAALDAARPLLVRGEPGTGKSQLARAAAVELGRAFVGRVVDARTESRDLLWTVDAVARLAKAQLQGALRSGEEADVKTCNFVVPAALWWAFNWDSAKDQAGRAKDNTDVALERAPEGWSKAQGVTVLIDEIDKADPSVPNGLLQALGDGEFSVPPGCLDAQDDRVVVEGAWPLVILTSNGERDLPEAFLRRCLVLQLALPVKRHELIEKLMERGHAHFPQASEAVLREAAEQLANDREKMAERRVSPPGQAEYIDLLRILLALAEREGCEPEILLDRLKDFVLRKHPDEHAR